MVVFFHVQLLLIELAPMVVQEVVKDLLRVVWGLVGQGRMFRQHFLIKVETLIFSLPDLEVSVLKVKNPVILPLRGSMIQFLFYFPPILSLSLIEQIRAIVLLESYNAISD